MRPDLLPRKIHEALRTPLVQHGVKANRAALETAAQFFARAGSSRVITLEEIFAPSTMDV